MSGICHHATDLIGNTPMMYINKLGRSLKARIAVKLEYLNPAGSVKDRIGYAMVEQAEQAGIIIPGVTTLIEATSGNTGIALAFVAAAKGYRLIITMPESMSVERRTLLRAYGAEIVLTDSRLGMQECVDVAKQLHEKIPNSYILGQFDNVSNPSIHYITTGPEIWRQTRGKVDACVFGVGTGGTITGVGNFLKQQNPDIKIYAVEPTECPLLSEGRVGPHCIQGIGPGFIPAVLDRSIYDGVIQVSSDEAILTTRQLAFEEGLLCGYSSGANVHAAMQLASRPEMEGKLIVTVLPSFGERYLSTDLYSHARDGAMQLEVQQLEENIQGMKMQEYDVEIGDHNVPIMEEDIDQIDMSVL